MVWVKSEYADELAVLSTWLSMVLPWTAAYHPNGPLGSIVVFFRFSVFELQLRFPAEITFDGVPVNVARALAAEYTGVKLAGNFYASVPLTGIGYYDGTVAIVYLLWTLAAAVLGVAFLLSLAMYVSEQRVRDLLSVPYHTFAGGLLGFASILLAIATVFLFVERGLFGIPLPIGLVVISALAASLLRAETVENPETATDENPETATDEAG